jgi:hypothetical protein
MALRFSRQLILSIAVVAAVASSALGDKRLLVPANISGHKSTIFEKVVVTSPKAQLRAKPNGEGTFIEPFAIFYKLYTDDKRIEENGHVRVGDSQGNPLGWIKSQDVADWSTRFVLEPLEPTSDRTFEVVIDKDNTAKLKTVPGGKRRFAFITSAPSGGKDAAENGPFPVLVCTAEVRGEGARSFTDELNDLKDLKLEIVFVLESTDFMLKEYGGKKLGDYMSDLTNQLANAVQSDAALVRSGGVRFGIVEYQDTSKEADYAARLTLPLTDNTEQFVTAVKNLRPKQINGDWPEDVLAGLKEALDKPGWSKNSIKHVIHIGQASMQLDPKGQGPNQIGHNTNVITAIFERSNKEFDFGFNSTGLTIDRLLQLANPEGGSVDEKARNQISFHSLWIGKPVEEDLREMLKDNKKVNADRLLTLAARAARASDAELENIFQTVQREFSIDGEKAIQLLVIFFAIEIQKYQDVLAQKQYQALTRNRGIEGYYRTVRPNAKELKSASDELTTKLRETIAATGKIRSGELDKPQDIAANNPILQRYYVVVGASADRLKDTPVLSGTAAVRDGRGRLVAQQKLLVTREELTRLRSTFDALHKTFQKMSAKVDRQDVSTILDRMKTAIAETAAGQKIDSTASLKSLITDLPLKTNALDVTPGDIAIMSSDAFGQWLNKLEASLIRIDDLLDGKAQWLALNEKAENDKFTFLHISELP